MNMRVPGVDSKHIYKFKHFTRTNNSNYVQVIALLKLVAPIYDVLQRSRRQRKE
jgi:hypothetical protein